MAVDGRKRVIVHVEAWGQAAGVVVRGHARLVVTSGVQLELPGAEIGPPVLRPIGGLQVRGRAAGPHEESRKPFAAGSRSSSQSSAKLAAASPSNLPRRSTTSRLAVGEAMTRT
jgi:hypothetical protein